MHVFVLTTGRSGSTTFARACTHIENYSVAHESRWQLLGPNRMQYADHHIEVDNRLAWLLGRLDDQFGDNAFYVHLIRDREAVANSYCQRRLGRESIIRAYSHGILYREHTTKEDCLDFYDTVNANIRLFLKDKTRTMTFDMAQSERDFPLFWQGINATGDLESALAEWQIPYNKLGTEQGKKSVLLQKYEKFKRVAIQFPEFLKNA